jgi:hypothetical protein
MKKHPILRLRKSEATKFNKMLGVIREEVQNFYSKVETITFEFKLSPNIFYSVDET